MEEKEFNDKYWFSNTKVVTVVNPRTEDFIFQSTNDVGIDTATGKMKSETRQYRVVHGSEERFPGPIANLYLDQMTKMLAQDDDKIQFLIDFALKSQYYDDLIVGVEDLINTYQSHPAYLDRSNEVETPVDEPEKPFANAEPEEVPKRKPGRPPKAAEKV